MWDYRWGPPKRVSHEFRLRFEKSRIRKRMMNRDDGILYSWHTLPPPLPFTVSAPLPLVSLKPGVAPSSTGCICDRGVGILDFCFRAVSAAVARASRLDAGPWGKWMSWAA